MSDDNVLTVLPVILAARKLLELGIEPVVLKSKSKQAIGGWKEDPPITIDNVAQRFRARNNVGMRLGARSNGLVDGDLDNSYAVRIARHFLPTTRRVFGRPSKPNSHLLWRSDLYLREEKDARKWIHPITKTPILELRIGGGLIAAQTVAPGSIHEGTGELIEWSEEGPIPAVDAHALIRGGDMAAIASLLLECYPEAGMQARHNFWLVVDGAFTSWGLTRDEREQIVEVVSREAGDPEVKDRLAICTRSESKTKLPGLRKLRELLSEPIANFINASLRPPSLAGFISVTKDGQPKATLANGVVALRKMEIVCKYDEFTRTHLTSGELVSEHLTPVTDDILMKLRESIEKEYHFVLKQTDMKDAVRFLGFENAFNSARDHFASLKWDEIPRLDGWLTRYGGVAYNEYTRAVGTLMLVAIIRRVRQPGAKFDEMVVLESKQGKNKSTALSILAGPGRFTDSVNFRLKDKEMIEQTRGKLIVEIPDLQGMTESKIDHIKALLSRTTDRSRMVWDIETTEAPRQFIFVGTTNDAQYLRDQTGNRRFWPIADAEFIGDCLEALKRDRDQIMAEAAHLEAQGYSIRLPEVLWPAAEKEQMARVASNPFVEILEQRLRKPTKCHDKDPGMYQGRMLMADVWELVEISVSQRSRQGKDLRAAINVFGRIANGRPRDNPHHTQSYPVPYAYFGDSEETLLVVLPERRDDRPSIMTIPEYEAKRQEREDQLDNPTKI